MVCFLAMSGASHNFIVIDEGDKEIESGTEACDFLEDSNRHLGNVEGEDQAHAFKAWCDAVKQTKFLMTLPKV